MQLPRFTSVIQRFSQEHIEDIEKAVADSLESAHYGLLFAKGEKVAITVGSRGINNLGRIVKTLIEKLRQLGCEPFIVPAMGSHGGATAEGQIEVLRSLGVTEESMGAPIKADMDVVEIGRTQNGATVYYDRQALGADAVVVLNRIKPHTRFKAANESGLMKMVAVGLGNHKGCSEMHAYSLYPTIINAARLSLSKTNIRMGIGIVENSYDQTAKIVAAGKENLEVVDAELLVLAKQLMPTLPVDDVDLLVVKEMGKNISGTGMDVNVLGRVSSPVTSDEVPRIKRIVALDLTEASHGNALGVGLADVITSRLAEKIDYHATYANVMAAGVLDRGKTPVTLAGDRAVIETALKSIENLQPVDARIIFIRNTLEMSRLTVSANVFAQIKNKPYISAVGTDFELAADENGNLPEAWWQG